MDIRIGVTQAPRELTVEIDDNDAAAVKSAVEAALAGATDVLWILDKKGKQLAVPSAKIAYVELGTSGAGRGIGFGSTV